MAVLGIYRTTKTKPRAEGRGRGRGASDRLNRLRRKAACLGLGGGNREYPVSGTGGRSAQGYAGKLIISAVRFVHFRTVAHLMMSLSTVGFTMGSAESMVMGENDILAHILLLAIEIPTHGRHSL